MTKTTGNPTSAVGYLRMSSDRQEESLEQRGRVLSPKVARG
jgi:hypothetical protein